MKHGLARGRRDVVDGVRAMGGVANCGERDDIMGGVEAGVTPYACCTGTKTVFTDGLGRLWRGGRGGEGKERFATALELGGEGGD